MRSWQLVGEFLVIPLIAPLLSMIVMIESKLTSDSILCSDYAIKRIDEPFVLVTDDLKEWAL
jgi:hypothetical protein